MLPLLPLLHVQYHKRATQKVFVADSGSGIFNNGEHQ
jgi:hypothetical protein